MNFVQEYLTHEQSSIDLEGVCLLLYSICIIYSKISIESYSQTLIGIWVNVSQTSELTEEYRCPGCACECYVNAIHAQNIQMDIEEHHGPDGISLLVFCLLCRGCFPHILRLLRLSVYFHC